MADRSDLSTGIILVCTICFLVAGHPATHAQETVHPCLGWRGMEIIPSVEFIRVDHWVANAQSGNSISLIPNDSCLAIRYSIAGGKSRWAQVYHVFDPPVSLNEEDVFALDIHGSSCGGSGPCHRNITLEFKFENGPL